MDVRCPQILRYGGVKTGWPGVANSPIAMIDTGGGPALMNDPKGYLYPKTWPLKVSCPQHIWGVRRTATALVIRFKSGSKGTGMLHRTSTRSTRAPCPHRFEA